MQTQYSPIFYVLCPVVMLARRLPYCVSEQVQLRFEASAAMLRS